MFVRNNLPAAMQGLMVVPIFAGYDTDIGQGRIWDYDATGGRYEEKDFVATGSGQLHASTVLRVSWRRDIATTQAVELVSRALWEASDADSATGGPDLLRGIYPIVATITETGYSQIDDSTLASIYSTITTGVQQR
jgi:proteasome beta subunit